MEGKSLGGETEGEWKGVLRSLVIRPQMEEFVSLDKLSDLYI